MSLQFTITIRVPDANGTLTDADSTPTIGIIRTDTSATVVASGALMTHDSTGVYSYTLSSPVAGVTYRATWVATVAGQALTDQFDLTATGDTWYYSDRAGVETLQDADTIAVIWDMDDDGTEDAGLMVRDGLTADAYINRFLRFRSVTAPVDLDAFDSVIADSLADISNHLTIWYGRHRRGLVELSNRLNRSADDLSGLMSGYKTYADQELEKLVRILLEADEDETSDDGFDSVPLAFDEGCGLCDENGCL